MALTDIDFNTTFDYEPSTKVFKFEDTVDYSGQSVNIANATGVIKVVAPSGATVYNNTNHGSPDIDPSVSRFNTTTIPLPLMGDGTVMQGTYSITYTVRYTDGTLSESYDVAATKTITLNYSSPSVDITMSYSCTTPILSSVDNTSYTVNLVTPTITRVHTLYYPASLQRSPITGTGSTVSTSTIFYVANQALQYTSTIVSTLLYDLGDGFYIEDSVNGAGYVDLTCDNSLCSIYCALRAQYNRWQNVKGTVQSEAIERNKFEAMMGVAQLAGIAIDCGKSDQVGAYINEIKAIGGFTDDCSCGDSTEPQLVVGLGSAGNVTVEAGTGIDVAAETGGSSTTYTVSLAQDYADKINNAYNSTVSAGAGITVNVTTASDGTKNYEVVNTQTQPNMVESIATMEFASGALPVIANESSKVYGTTLQNVTVEANNDGSVSDWQNNAATFTVSNFFVSATAAFYPSVDIIYSIAGSFGPNIFSRPYVAEIYNYSSNTISFRLTDRTTGQVVTGATIDADYTNLKVLISIIS